ncbi:MAG TPA: hypothetical protein DCE42_03910, partial [Myxococcales bacterium]|nr:hypothetical protein [Myxococcales bacterium]
PFALLYSPDRGWGRWLAWLFVAVFWGMVIWCGIWYFIHYSWNYRFRWLFLATILVIMLTYISFRRRPQNAHVLTQDLLFYVWLIGLCIVLAFLGVLIYHIIYQIKPEASTSTILMGSAFVFFLTLTIIRVYLLDSTRFNQANRVDQIKPGEWFLLLEWFIPRSTSFIAILFLLILSEAMLFSTIYNAIHPLPDTPAHSLNVKPTPSSSPARMTRKAPVTSPLNKILSKRRKGTLALHQTYHPSLMEWFSFSIKPYVFPKNNLDQEVRAPEWFKYLGRILLGILFAILLTQQLNIWKQFYDLFRAMLGCVYLQTRRGKSPELTRQIEENLERMRSLLNKHDPFWRQLIFTSCTIKPSSWLRWMLIVDPSATFYEFLSRFEHAIVTHWERTLFLAGVILVSICTPFALLTTINLKVFLLSFTPALVAALLIFLMRYAFGMQPPKIYSVWIWWFLLLHIIFSLLLFFLSLISTREGFWQILFWYGSLSTVLIFPVLYIFGGERYKAYEQPGRRSTFSPQDSDVLVRKMILREFFAIEHRQWLLNVITSRIHPVRSSGIKLRLILPSLSMGALEQIRIWVESLGGVVERTLASFVRSLTTWLVLQLVGFAITFVWHLIMFHRLFPPEIMRVYQVTLVALITPSLLGLLFAFVLKWYAGGSAPERKQKHYFFALFTVSTLVTTTFWMIFNAPFPMWWGLLYAFLAFVMSFPWIGLVSLINLVGKEEGIFPNASESQTRLIPHRPRFFERVATWLEKREESFLRNVYKGAANWQQTEPQMREELIKGCATILEETQKAIISGEWYEEEEHALNSMYRYWFLDDEDDSKGQDELGRKWLSLVGQLLDPLVALLQDMVVTDRFKNVDAAPDLEVTLKTTERILQLCSFFQQPAAEEHREQHLFETLEDIHTLIEEALPLWTEDEHTSYRCCAYRILALLGQSRGAQMLKGAYKRANQAERLLILPAIARHPDVNGFLEQVQNEQPEESALYVAATQEYLCDNLPTPVAHQYTEYLKLKERYHKLKQSLDQPPSPPEKQTPLEQVQQLDVLIVSKEKCKQEAAFKELTDAYADHIAHTYQSLFAYIFSTLKDLVPQPSIQSLQWEHPTDIQESIAHLESLELPEIAHTSLELLQALFSFENARKLFYLCGLRNRLSMCEEFLEKTFFVLLEHIDEIPQLYWRMSYKKVVQTGFKAIPTTTLQQYYEVILRGT